MRSSGNSRITSLLFPDVHIDVIEALFFFYVAGCLRGKGQIVVSQRPLRKGKQYEQKVVRLLLFSIIFEHFHLCLMLSYSSYNHA